MQASRRNIQRLLAPRHIAFIGGNDADFAARQCAQYFNGPVWGVNPGRETLGDQPCYTSVADLPEAPDAVFLAVPRKTAMQTVAELREIGAGGIVCYTAGFGELGAEGAANEKKLVATAGDLALVGPNCYGLINYTKNAVLWPYGCGESHVERGIALVMQSGMLASNLTMNQRSVPLAYVISAGNQAMLAVEDYIDVLIDDPAVTAIGLYVEGISNAERFGAAALRALEKNIPIVALKAGSSEIGSKLTISHTGSLSGSDEVYQAFFDRFGIIRVRSPTLLLETLKLLSFSGAPKGIRVAAFTCSGGDAAMLADEAEHWGIDFPQPSTAAHGKLTGLLPDIATVSNPLDYTTPLWGNAQQMPLVFGEMLNDTYDAALLIQDYPSPEMKTSKENYLQDARSFMTATQQAGIPAAICSELSENIDRESREIMIAGGITPLQGIENSLATFAMAGKYSLRREQILSASTSPVVKPLAIVPDVEDLITLDEWDSKQLLNKAGIPTPKSQLVSAEQVTTAAAEIGFPVVAKLAHAEIPHKTEAGAIKTNLMDADAVTAAIESIHTSVQRHTPDLAIKNFLIERQIPGSLAELLIGVRCDAQFGQTMVIASGGIMVELLADQVTLLLPTDSETVVRALRSLRIFPLLNGFRGKPGTDMALLTETILKLAKFAEENAAEIDELDINPLLVMEYEVVAADGLMRVSKNFKI